MKTKNWLRFYLTNKEKTANKANKPSFSLTFLIEFSNPQSSQNLKEWGGI